MSPAAAIIRQANIDRRNRNIREAFYQRYIRVLQEHKPTRDWVVA